MADPDPYEDDMNRDQSLISWLASGRTFVGGLAVGLSINAVSDAYPGALAPAISVAAFLVLFAAVALRRLSPRARIQGAVRGLSLAASATALIVSLFVPGNGADWAVLIATTLGVIGCLRPGPPERIFRQLVGIALVAAGVAIIGFGVTRLLSDETLSGISLLVDGFAVVGFGIAVLRRSRKLGGASFIVDGVAGIGVSVALFLDSRILAGVSAVVLAVAAILFGSALVLGSRQLGGAFAILAGLAVGGGGISFIEDSRFLAGLGDLGVGIAMVAGGVALILGLRKLGVVAALVLGCALVTLGIARLPLSLPAGVALAVAGTALVGGSTFELVRGGGPARWVTYLLAEPDVDR